MQNVLPRSFLRGTETDILYIATTEHCVQTIVPGQFNCFCSTLFDICILSCVFFVTIGTLCFNKILIPPSETGNLVYAENNL